MVKGMKGKYSGIEYEGYIGYPVSDVHEVKHLNGNFFPQNIRKMKTLFMISSVMF